MTKYWTLQDARDQTGRVAIVTGSNTGLGFETALGLAAKNARVVLACRDREKADAARRRIALQYPSAQIDVRGIDTGNLSSVRQFVQSFSSEYDRLDLLINNAGIMITPHFTTEDGLEGQFAVNFLGHFLLTGLLLPLLHRTAQSRVVSLHSIAANWGHIHFDDLQFAKKYDPVKAYAQRRGRA